jgi:branched-chain amino acid transport system permease protein
LILLVGGFTVARITWARVAAAWDDALSSAREKGLAA